MTQAAQNLALNQLSVNFGLNVQERSMKVDRSVHDGSENMFCVCFGVLYHYFDVERIFCESTHGLFQSRWRP